MINFDAGSLGTDQSYYQKPENSTEVRAYLEFLTDFILLTNKRNLTQTTVSEEAAKEKAREHFVFEKILAEVSY